VPNLKSIQNMFPLSQSV